MKALGRFKFCMIFSMPRGCGAQFYDSGDLSGLRNVALRSLAIPVYITLGRETICWILAICSFAVKREKLTLTQTGRETGNVSSYSGPTPFARTRHPPCPWPRRTTSRRRHLIGHTLLRDGHLVATLCPFQPHGWCHGSHPPLWPRLLRGRAPCPEILEECPDSVAG